MLWKKLLPVLAVFFVFQGCADDSKTRLLQAELRKAQQVNANLKERLTQQRKEHKTEVESVRQDSANEIKELKSELSARDDRLENLKRAVEQMKKKSVSSGSGNSKEKTDESKAADGSEDKGGFKRTKMKKCARCKGSGTIRVDCSYCGGTGKCPGCKGTGKVGVSSSASSSLVRHALCRGTGKCPKCKGKGYSEETCPDCHGSGFVKE